MEDQEAGPINEAELKPCRDYKERSIGRNFYKKAVVSLAATVCLGFVGTSHLLIGVLISMNQVGQGIGTL